MFRGETVTCNYSEHSSETHTLTQNILLCLRERVNPFLYVSGKSWKPKRTKTGTHTLCQGSSIGLQWAGHGCTYITWLGLLISHSVNGPFVYSLHVLQNMGRMWNLQVDVKGMINVFVYSYFSSVIDCRPVHGADSLPLAKCMMGYAPHHCELVQDGWYRKEIDG